MIVLVFVVQIQAQVQNCNPDYGTTAEQCKLKMAFCGQRGYVLKFGGVGCVKPNGQRFRDGGCQCDGYCGYNCQTSCQADVQCKWSTTTRKCLTKAGKPGVPIPKCPQTPTKAPSKSPITSKPSKQPTTSVPSRVPSRTPSLTPIRTPSQTPSVAPSTSPSVAPSTSPSVAPSTSPTKNCNTVQARTFVALEGPGGGFATYTDAKAACVAIAGIPVQVNSQTVNDDVVAALASGTRAFYYLGATRAGTLGTSPFQWENLGVFYPDVGCYNNFAAGEPNNGGNPPPADGDEDCVSIYRPTSTPATDGKWNDLSCSFGNMGVVCEIPPVT